MIDIKEGKDIVTLRLRVQPRASRTELAGEYGGAIKLRLSAPPVDGKANEACRSFLAELFGVSKSAVEIVAGDSSRDKVVRVSGLTANQVLSKLFTT